MDPHCCRGMARDLLACVVGPHAGMTYVIGRASWEVRAALLGGSMHKCTLLHFSLVAFPPKICAPRCIIFATI